MKLIQLQFLVGLKKYGSFSRTAQKMYISQPVISVAIKTLEEELGRPLLERSNKGVTFTPFGELVLEQAQIIELAVNQISNICNQEDTGIYGTMTVCFPAAFVQHASAVNGRLSYVPWALRFLCGQLQISDPEETYLLRM